MRPENEKRKEERPEDLAIVEEQMALVEYDRDSYNSIFLGGGSSEFPDSF